MPAEPRPGAGLTAITVLPLAEPDHNAELPKADMTPAERPAEDAIPTEPPKKKGLSQGMKVAIFIVIFLLLYIALDRF
jgi:hypothetical protein